MKTRFPILLMHTLYLISSIFIFVLSYLLYFLLPTKLKAWVKLKTQFLKNDYQSDSEYKTYWFHAASGEIEYAKSTIRELRKMHNNNIRIVVTYSSPSANKLFTNIQDQVDAFIPLCWDLDIFNNMLIEKIKPNIVIFARTDFWPRLIYNLKRHKIPMVAISVFPSTSHLNNLWYQYVLSPFTLVTCINPESQKYMKSILANTRIEFVPDNRFDQVSHRLNHPPKINFTHSINYKLITIGSSWPNDEKVIQPIVSELKEKGYKIIWAPHESKNSIGLKKKLKSESNDLKVLSLSEVNDQINCNVNDFDILIIDQIGYLADIYRYSSIAFIGGSFVSKVHSVMEALCAQNLVIIGPFYKNNPEAVHFMNLGAVKIIQSSIDFMATVEHFEAHSDQLKNVIKSELNQFIGGTDKTIQLLSEII